MANKDNVVQCNLTPEEAKKLQEKYPVVYDEPFVRQETDPRGTLVIRIDWWLGRVIAMTWAITEVAKKRDVRVITSRPLAFWWNPYIQSVHGIDDRRNFKDVIRGNDYKELEPYTDPHFFNDGTNWLEVAAMQLQLDKIAEPILFMAEHEKLQNFLQGNKVILFQAFGSSMNWNGADKSYRSFRVNDAQYVVNELNKLWYTVYIPERDDQPKIQGSRQLTTQDMRWLVNLADRYPVVGCDSSLQHAAKAFNKQSVISWSGTDAGRFGYDSHINMRMEDKPYTYVPFRLWIDFDLDIINQHTNQYTKEYLDKFIQNVVKVSENFGANATK